VRHELAGGEYNERRASCERVAETIAKFRPKVRALRDLAQGDLEHCRNQISDVDFRRCRHVITENDRVRCQSGIRERQSRTIRGADVPLPQQPRPRR